MVQGTEPVVSVQSHRAAFLVRHCRPASDCGRWIRLGSRVQLFDDLSTGQIVFTSLANHKEATGALFPSNHPDARTIHGQR
jgi:hypothetical protein